MSAVAAVARSALVQKARQFPARAFLLWGALLAVTGGAVFLWVLAAGGAPRARQAGHGNFLFFHRPGQALGVFAASQKLAQRRWVRGEVRRPRAPAPVAQGRLGPCL